ncbi:phage tail tube protein [Sphingobacterium sp. 1.A.4]|uniref:phage tail tube protein n=1 Tax=Sphingobacterium sp. 1.A.4 TaxID=2044603 RepID=UPI000C0BEA7E|nr:hypothetical protein [Sphingobacterium sp. 1.A.4]
MAKTKSSLGLKKIEIADVPATGLPTSWTELKATKIGTAVLTEEDDNITNIFIEQSDEVYRTITTERGATTFAFEMYEITAANLAKLKGGTATTETGSVGATWDKSVNSVELFQSVRITTLDDYQVIIPNGNVKARITWTMTKEDLATVSITITVNTPLDETLPPLRVIEPLSV